MQARSNPIREPGAGRDGPATDRFAMDRRAAITGALATLAGLPLAAWPILAEAADLPLDRARFLELSRKLCGHSFKAGSLADDLQAGVLAGQAPGGLVRLAELIATAPAAEVDRLVAQSDVKVLAEAIVAAWYTGMVGPADMPRVVTHEDALAWPATGYAKAPGTCGQFGEWTAMPAPAKP